MITNTAILNSTTDAAALAADARCYCYDSITTTAPNYSWLSDTIQINQDVNINGTIKINGVPIEAITSQTKAETENTKENKKMFNFDFGPCDSNIKLSPYGVAVKGANGTYVAYDPATKSIMDVDILNFDACGMVYKMPSALSDIEPGDLIIHNKKPMYVIGFNGSSGVEVVDVFNGECKTILPAVSPFGFNFVVRVVSVMDFAGPNMADANNPFGNMWPLFLTNNNDNSMLMMAMMMGKGKMDPMMMAMLMSQNGNNSMMPLIMMGMMNKD